jgi:5S rRNA maturation endonuclease (ribonuclease M5)
MTPDRIRALLPKLASKAYGKRAGWILGTCPMLWNHGGSESDAFGVSFSDKKKSRCKCLSCGYSGDLTDLLFDVRDGLRKHPAYASRFDLKLASAIVSSEFESMELLAEDIPDFEAHEPKTEVVFPESWLATFKRAVDFPQALGDMTKRGIRPETVEALDVRFDAVQGRVCFPVRDFNGRLMGLQGRKIMKNPSSLTYNQYGYKGFRNMNIWMGEHELDLDKPVVLCEGPFDFAKIWQVYTNVAASFTSGLSKAKTLRMGDADDIVTFYDYGKGGDAARKYIHNYLAGPQYNIVDIVPSQEEDDAGSMPESAIMEYLSEHVVL